MNGNFEIIYWAYLCDNCFPFGSANVTIYFQASIFQLHSHRNRAQSGGRREKCIPLPINTEWEFVVVARRTYCRMKIRNITSRISMKIDISQIKCSHDAAWVNKCANALCIAHRLVRIIWSTLTYISDSFPTLINRFLHPLTYCPLALSRATFSAMHYSLFTCIFMHSAVHCTHLYAQGLHVETKIGDNTEIHPLFS